MYPRDADPLSNDPICDPFDDGDMHQYNTPIARSRELSPVEMDAIDPHGCHAEGPEGERPTLVVLIIGAAGVTCFIGAVLLVALGVWVVLS